MFIRSSTAINDCLIALDTVQRISKSEINNDNLFLGKEKWKESKEYKFGITIETKAHLQWIGYAYESQEARDKAFDELCAFLNSNYKLRDFT